MNANVIARLMFLTLQSFIRGELPREEFNEILQDLASQARSGGIGEEAQAAYWEMCQAWFSQQAA